MTTRARPRRLGAAARQAVAGNCPHCPPPGTIALVEIDEAGHALSGEYPLRVPGAGPHEGVRLIEVV